MNWRSLIFKQSPAKPEPKEPTLNAAVAAPVVAVPDRRGGGRGAENPYLNYRRRWNDHTGSILSQRNMWMLFCMGSLMIALAAVGGLISVAQKSKFVPYVIEVDKLGQAAAQRPIQQTETVDPRVIKSSLAEFISQSRLVTFDVQLQRDAIYKVYARLANGDPALTKMNEYLNGKPENTPFKRAEKETVSVEISSILQQTAQTWQVDWVETIRDRKGTLTTKPIKMRALINVGIIEPTEETSEAQLRNNPLGVFVVDFNWSRILDK